MKVTVWFGVVGCASSDEVTQGTTVRQVIESARPVLGFPKDAIVSDNSGNLNMLDDRLMDEPVFDGDEFVVRARVCPMA